MNTIDWKSSHKKLWEWPYLRLRLILRNPPTGVSRVLQSRLRVWCPWTRAVTRVPREVQEYWKWSFPAPRWEPGESAASEPWSAAVAAEGWTREERNRKVSLFVIDDKNLSNLGIGIRHGSNYVNRIDTYCACFYFFRLNESAREILICTHKFS